MSRIKVIVVPENEFFAKRLAYEEVIFINKKLGKPLLKKHNAKYAAPYLLDAQNRGVKRLYHIIGQFDDGKSTVLKLGNSFILDEVWDNRKNKQSFEYKELKDFDCVEIKDGLLMPYKF